MECCCSWRVKTNSISNFFNEWRVVQRCNNHLVETGRGNMYSLLARCVKDRWTKRYGRLLIHTDTPVQVGNQLYPKSALKLSFHNVQEHQNNRNGISQPMHDPFPATHFKLPWNYQGSLVKNGNFSRWSPLGVGMLTFFSHSSSWPPVIDGLLYIFSLCRPLIWGLLARLLASIRANSAGGGMKSAAFGLGDSVFDIRSWKEAVCDGASITFSVADEGVVLSSA